MLIKKVNLDDAIKNHTGRLEKAMKTHENDPYFIKKTKKAAATLKKCVLPPGLENTIIS